MANVGIHAFLPLNPGYFISRVLPGFDCTMRCQFAEAACVLGPAYESSLLFNGTPASEFSFRGSNTPEDEASHFDRLARSYEIVGACAAGPDLRLDTIPYVEEILKVANRHGFAFQVLASGAHLKLPKDPERFYDEDSLLMKYAVLMAKGVYTRFSVDNHNASSSFSSDGEGHVGGTQNLHTGFGLLIGEAVNQYRAIHGGSIAQAKEFLASRISISTVARSALQVENTLRYLVEFKKGSGLPYLNAVIGPALMPGERGLEIAPSVAKVIPEIISVCRQSDRNYPAFSLEALDHYEGPKVWADEGLRVALSCEATGGPSIQNYHELALSSGLSVHGVPEHVSVVRSRKGDSHILANFSSAPSIESENVVSMQGRAGRARQPAVRGEEHRRFAVA